MALQTLFLFSGILMIIAGHMLQDEDLKTIIPHYYNIKLSPYKNVDLFRGEYDVTFTILNNTRTITLQSENIFILKAAIISRPRLPRVSEKEVKDTLLAKDIYVPRNILLDKMRKTIVLQFTNTLLPGYHILNVVYFGQINSNDNGLFKIPATDNTGKPMWILTTHLITSGARELLPHLDDSTGKTTFEISVQHTLSDTAYTSENIFRRLVTVKSFKSLITSHFVPTPPMSVTKISICVLPDIWKIKNIILVNDGIIYIPVPPKGLQYDDHIIESVFRSLMPFFTVKFGKPRNEFYVRFFSFLGFHHDSIASVSIVLHRTDDLFFDDTFTVIKRVQKRNTQRFFAHQIALQWLLWFIDSVKPWSSWSYQRINAVAEFLGIYALEKTFPHLKIMDEFVLRTVHDSLHLDVDNLMEPITGQTRTLSNDTHFRIPSFIKLSALLRTIEYELGQQFWEDGETYLKHGPRSNIWSCFLSNFQSLPSKPDRNCKTFWIWIVKSNYVLLNVQQRTSCHYAVYADSSNFIKMKEEINKNLYWLPFHTLDFRFNVYLDYYIERNFTMTVECPVVYEKADDTHYCLPAVNARRLGYYRVNYDYEKWPYPKEISILYRDNSVLTRAQIIDDEYHLLDKKETTLSAWKRITLYLLIEYEYEAWYPAIRMLEEMSGFLPFSDNSNITSFKALVKEPLDEILHRVGYWTDSDKSDFQLFLRYEAFKWACLLNSSSCHFFADKVTKNIIYFIGTNFTQDTVFWQEWIYCEGLRHKTIAVLKYIIRHSMWKNNFNDTLVKYIPCLGFDEAVAYVHKIHQVFGTELYKYKHIAIFQSFVAKYANTNTTQILNKLSAVKPRTLKRRTALCIIINHIYYERLLIEILLFVRAEEKKAPTQDLYFVLKKLNLRLSQIEKHRKRFMQLFR